MMRALVRFLDERLGSNAGARFMLRKIYPDHWSFYLGEFALYAFGLLVATGVWLTFAYQANDRDAYGSVVALSRAAPIGYLIRQVHHWSAVTFVAAILIHMARIFFTAAFRKPRELNWVVGVTMLILASLDGLTGYSLPNDALSGTGLRITDSIVLSVPFAGAWASDVLDRRRLSRSVLVAASVHDSRLLFAGHHRTAAGRASGNGDPSEAHPVRQRTAERRRTPLLAGLRTSHTLAALAATVAVIVALASTVEINAIDAYGPYSDWTVPNPAVPDWYAGFLDGALRLGPSWEVTIFGHPIPGDLLARRRASAAGVRHDPMLAVDRCRRFARPAPRTMCSCRPRFAPWRTGVGSALIAAGTFLTLAASDDQQAFVLHQPVQSLVTFYRFLVPIGSLAVGVLAAIVARELRARSAAFGTESERAVVLRRNAAGGFDEEAIGRG